MTKHFSSHIWRIFATLIIAFSFAHVPHQVAQAAVGDTLTISGTGTAIDGRLCIVPAGVGPYAGRDVFHCYLPLPTYSIWWDIVSNQWLITDALVGLPGETFTTILYNNSAQTLTHPPATGWIMVHAPSGTPPRLSGAVSSSPVLSKSFTDDPVLAGDTVTLDFTITNNSTTESITDISFHDSLSTGLTGSTGSIVNPCGIGSTITGTTTLSLSDGTLGANSSCTFSVTVTVSAGMTPGNYTNSTSAITGTVDGISMTGNIAHDDLVVVAPEIDVQRPAGSTNSIADGLVDWQGVKPVGDQVTLTYTIANSGTSLLTVTNITSSGAYLVIVDSISKTSFSVAAGSSDTFDVKYTPIGVGWGNFSFEIDITNDDSDEGNYDIKVEGIKGMSDYGDAPDPLDTTAGEYPTLLASNGARHILSGPTLGTNRDSETDGQPTASADGDDHTGTPNDEDGVIFGTIIASANQSNGASLILDLQNADATSNRLDAWIDFNADGDWDDIDEQIFTNFNLGTTNGTQSLFYTIPQDTGSNVSAGNTFARVRLSTTGGLSTTGLASDGEVEDYQVSITLDSNVPIVDSTDLVASYLLGPTSISIKYSEDVYDPTGNTDIDDVTNPNNYLLVEAGKNRTFDTNACYAEVNGGIQPDDVQIAVNNVSYDPSTFTATVNINNGIALPDGSYRLFVCGTTSIVDLANNILNGGADAVFDFTVAAPTQSLPATGFAPGHIIDLPLQPHSNTYSSTELTLEIPALVVTMPIVGVPFTDGNWDVTWLGNNAGYLSGSAFPTWPGNTVLTGHVWDAWNQPGPFAKLKTLKHGDQVYIHSWGLTYTYEVRESRLWLTKASFDKAFKHEKYDWVTLLTCETYNPFNGDYIFRRVVRAVLVSIK